MPHTVENHLRNHPEAAEYRFLFDCCRAAFSGASLRYPDKIRPDVFMEIVRHHKLIPHLYPVLTNRCENVSEAIRAQFRQSLQQHHLHILKLSGELARLSKSFAANDLPWLSVKGPALSLLLYGDIAMRQSGDLDILVDEKDLTRAQQLLKDAGYYTTSNDQAFNKRQLAHYRKYDSNYSWVHPAKNIHVELHWQLIPDEGADDRTNRLRNRTDIMVGNHPIPTLRRTTYVLYLCRHGSAHLWFRLFWLWDVAFIFRHLHENECRELIPLIRQLRLEKIFAQAAYLSQQIFGVSPPSAFAQRTCSNRILTPAFRYILTNSTNTATRRLWCEYIYQLRLQSGLRYWWALSALRWNNPRDWETIRLPEALFFLYYVIKPVAFIIRKLRG
jgi:hypothetical protein